jgi:dihydrofolate reductase
LGIRFSVFIATSLDGYIARKNGDLDWLPGSDATASNEDHGYQEFIATIDTLVMGRNTYELVLTFGEWPYRGKRVVVLSSRFPKQLTRLADGVEGTSAAPAELARQLAASGATHVYVDGGMTIQSFLQAGLIQDMIITRVPVLIGAGIPLFGPLAQDIRLRHESTRSFASGLVQSRYTLLDAARIETGIIACANPNGFLNW